MVSHYDWRDRAHILAWARQEDVGNRFFLFTDRSDQRETIGEGILTTDGHCSFSPDRHWILTDTYPDEERMRTLILYCVEDNRRVDVGRFFAPPELDGEIRCDLHPRWSRDGRQVCFDSVEARPLSTGPPGARNERASESPAERQDRRRLHEGTRQMYVIDVSDIVAGR